MDPFKLRGPVFQGDVFVAIHGKQAEDPSQTESIGILLNQQVSMRTAKNRE